MPKPKAGKDQTETQTQTTDLTEPIAALQQPTDTLVTETTKPTSLNSAEGALVKLEDALAQAAEEGNELTETQLETAANAYLEATNAAKDAVERYCWLIFNRLTRSDERKAQAKVWEGRAKDLKVLAGQDENLALRLKRKLLQFMDRREIPKLETTTFKLSARNNGGKQPLVVDETYSIQYIAQFYPNLLRFEIDKDAVREFLEQGGELPFAHLEERGRSLVIRP